MKMDINKVSNYVLTVSALIIALGVIATFIGGTTGKLKSLVTEDVKNEIILIKENDLAHNAIEMAYHTKLLDLQFDFILGLKSKEVVLIERTEIER
jgi:hypothetical protein